jgi:hypothetical protein
MRSQKARTPPDVALLQLGSEVHAALESASRQSGYSKSEFVRLAVQGAVHAQKGYWERLLMQVLIAVPELVEAAADAGLLTREEMRKINWPMDVVRQRLYGELDRVDGFPSIHWVPAKGEPIRSYEEVMRTRASRDELVRPEIAPLEQIGRRFGALAAQRLRDGKKIKTDRPESRKAKTKFPLLGDPLSEKRERSK